MIWNKSEAIAAFGITYPTMTQWIKKGFPIKQLPGNIFEINPTEAIEWYLQYKTSALQSKLESLKDNNVDYDLEYKRWKSVRMKIESFKESGSLITVDEAEDALLQRLVVIREALKNIPLSWTHAVIGLENEQEAQLILEELLDDLMGVLSQAPDELVHEVGGSDVLDVDIADVEDVEDYDVK
jgi:phage terminase Nu1 subunit (DNA packaging protein)